MLKKQEKSWRSPSQAPSRLCRGQAGAAGAAVGQGVPRTCAPRHFPFPPAAK